MSDKVYSDIGYDARTIGFGERPGIAVVDFQLGFTDPDGQFSSKLVERAILNTSKILRLAREVGVPVANCYTAYHSGKDMPYWKIGPVHETFYYGHPCTQMEPRTSDQSYDFIFCKHAPSIFFNTPANTFFTKYSVDTMIVVGCMTSGCIRASVIDSFSTGYKTIVPEDCVGDADDRPHQDNLRDIGRRYADVLNSSDVIEYLEDYRGRNY